MTNEEKKIIEKDILFQIDMELYDKFNDKFCEINDNLGDIYTYRDLEELKQAEKNEEIRLLRKAIKELESDNYECNNIIREYIEDWELKTKMIELMAEHLTTPIHSKKNVIEYFENLAKESVNNE